MRPPRRVEIAVIGGGPSGSALAAALASRGRQVALFERDEFPRNKVCGEFLSPESVACLEQLGCLNAFHKLAPSKMFRTRLTCEDGSEVTLPLPETAFGLSRRTLDKFLFDHAGQCGAQTFEGAEVRRFETTTRQRKRLFVDIRQGQERHRHIVDADVIVGAYGRRTRLDRHLQRPFFEKRSPYVAFKRHHRVVCRADVPPLRGAVELHTFNGGYCGVSFAEENQVNVCTMVDRRLLQSEDWVDKDSLWQILRKDDSPLARRLATLEPDDSETVTASQIPLTTRKVSHRDVLFVGDAATMIAPLAGDGQAMALESALTLAELLHTHLPKIPHYRWALRWRSRYEARIRLGQWIHKAMIRPEITSPALRTIAHWPTAGQRIIRMTRG